jgi:hypothetical protein
MCHEPQTWNFMAFEKMYIIYFMHIDFIKSINIESNLTLIQNELWVPKYCYAHFKVFFLCLVFSKDAIKISTYYIPIILVIHHFFGWKVMKSGSHGMCFHLFPTIDCCVGECNSTFQCLGIFAITFPISNVHLLQNGKHLKPLSNLSVGVSPIFNSTKPILMELFHLENRCPKLMSSLKAS